MSTTREGYCTTKHASATPIVDQNNVSSRSALAVKPAGGETPTALLKVTRSMQQKALQEFSSGGFECPNCAKETGSMRGLASHWDQIHDDPRPDWIYYSVSEEHGENISKAQRGRELSEEHKQKLADSDYYQSDEYQEKMSEALSGREKSEEHKEKIAESMSGENNPMYGSYGEEHHNHGVTWSEETREKMSEARKGISGGGKTDTQTVNETGHVVKSSWEAKVDRLLYNNNAEFEYEPETFKFESGRAYTPDFIVSGEIVVEVKGHIWNDWDKERASLFMDQYPDYTYIVVGEKLPCDLHYPWDNMEQLTEVL